MAAALGRWLGRRDGTAPAGKAEQAGAAARRPPGESAAAAPAAAGVAGTASSGATGAVADHAVAVLCDALLALPGELAGMGRRLQLAIRVGDAEAAARALRQLVQHYLNAAPEACPETAAEAQRAQRVRELFARTLQGALASLLQGAPELAAEAEALAGLLRQAPRNEEAEAFDTRLKNLTHRVALGVDDAAEQHALLMSLFALLLENIGELLDRGSWMHGQIELVRALIASPVDRSAVEDARASLREVIYRQGVLRHAMDENREAMTSMVTGFVEGLETTAASTGEFHERISSHSAALAGVRNIGDLHRVLESVLDDTGRMQAQMLRARDEMVAARDDVAAAEARIEALERALHETSAQAMIDPLTGGLNRRGLDDMFEREAAAAQDRDAPLCLAMLDLDDFRRLNERLGHLGGDAALRHLVQTVKRCLREVDAIARFGGEEFLILLPGLGLEQAAAQVRHVQRTLTQAFFLHNNERVFITFSAGVALHVPGESQRSLVERADRAMYEAKRGGKNRVVTLA